MEADIGESSKSQLLTINATAMQTVLALVSPRFIGRRTLLNINSENAKRANVADDKGTESTCVSRETQTDVSLMQGKITLVDVTTSNKTKYPAYLEVIKSPKGTHAKMYADDNKIFSFGCVSLEKCKAFISKSDSSCVNLYRSPETQTNSCQTSPFQQRKYPHVDRLNITDPEEGLPDKGSLVFKARSPTEARQWLQAMTSLNTLPTDPSVRPACSRFDED